MSKPKKDPLQSVNFKQLERDVQKHLDANPLNQRSVGAPRRYEPAGGVQKHNERIHRESSYADSHKNLEFTFRKPPKPKGSSAVVQCDNCGYVTSGTTATVGIVCPECHQYSSVSEVVYDG